MLLVSIVGLTLFIIGILLVIITNFRITSSGAGDKRVEMNNIISTLNRQETLIDEVKTDLEYLTKENEHFKIDLSQRSKLDSRDAETKFSEIVNEYRRLKKNIRELDQGRIMDAMARLEQRIGDQSREMNSQKESIQSSLNMKDRRCTSIEERIQKMNSDLAANLMDARFDKEVLQNALEGSKAFRHEVKESFRAVNSERNAITTRLNEIAKDIMEFKRRMENASLDVRSSKEAVEKALEKNRTFRQEVSDALQARVFENMKENEVLKQKLDSIFSGMDSNRHILENSLEHNKIFKQEVRNLMQQLSMEKDAILGRLNENAAITEELQRSLDTVSRESANNRDIMKDSLDQNRAFKHEVRETIKARLTESSRENEALKHKLGNVFKTMESSMRMLDGGLAPNGYAKPDTPGLYAQSPFPKNAYQQYPETPPPAFSNQQYPQTQPAAFPKNSFQQYHEPHPFTGGADDRVSDNAEVKMKLDKVLAETEKQKEAVQSILNKENDRLGNVEKRLKEITESLLSISSANESKNEEDLSSGADTQSRTLEAKLENITGEINGLRRKIEKVPGRKNENPEDLRQLLDNSVGRLNGFEEILNDIKGLVFSFIDKKEDRETIDTDIRRAEEELTQLRESIFGQFITVYDNAKSIEELKNGS